MDNRNRRRKKRNTKAIVTRYLGLLVVIALVLTSCIAYVMLRKKDGSKPIKQKQSVTQDDKSNNKDGKSNVKDTDVVATAKVLSTGDILIHTSLLKGAEQQDGTYDFNKSFKHVTPIVKQADMAVCNLEVTLGGPDRKYSSFPLFNTPDTIADAIKNAGFDVVLTSNNHSYDTGAKGLVRTPTILKQKDIVSTGTRISESDKPYVIKKVNGIKIGIINYTYETPSKNGQKALNGNFVKNDVSKLVNSFNYDNLDAFYKEINSRIKDMKKDGAQATMVYMHWGDEYRTSPNSYQQEIAKKLCDMDVDALIGGHPHVVQPVKVITSENTGNKMVCLYSMGNALSNQRIALMDLKTGHTEDGIMFYTTFTKYGNGDVKLTKVDCIPTWVNIANINNKKIHQIIPLKDINTMASSYGLSSVTKQKAINSFERTQKLVKEGIDFFNNPIPKETPSTTKEAA